WYTCFPQPAFSEHFLQRKRNMTTLEYLEKVVLKTLWNHKYSWIFQHPTDETNFLSNNTNVIKNPPDLMTIRKKFDTKSYMTAVECLQDFHSIFRNCYLKFRDLLTTNTANLMN
uniref:Bromo domain-containing protein n=1 Tax=Leptobrachium leishanense TaxID=445787 RepID=A0A8C5QXI6_9ANUR